jgi:hypothetical protein
MKPSNSYLPQDINVSADSNAYDSTIDILKTINLSKPTILSPDVILDTTSVALGTGYFPSSDGLVLVGKNPSFQIRVICGSSATQHCNASTWFERSDEPDGVTPVKWWKCTEQAMISAYGTNSNPSYGYGKSGFVSFGISPSEYLEVCLDFNDFKGYRIRQALTIDTSPNNTIYTSVIQQPLEG